MKLSGTISIDIDTLHSIFKGENLASGEKYDWCEFEEGLINICNFFAKLGIKTTLFCVGHDFTVKKNQKIIKDVYLQGHEIANHTMNHSQGLRLLSKNQKEKEISAFEEICKTTIGEKPIGFRAPGWNIDEEVLKILIKRGYKYDSSIFPTFLMPIMKFMHYATMKNRSYPDRTTMGRLSYMFCPVEPYRTSIDSFNSGKNGLMEFPISVSPHLRFPLFATMLLKLGMDNFQKTFNEVKQNGKPVQFMLHLFDFVDFSKKSYARQTANLKGVYIPQSITMNYVKKMDLIKRALDIMMRDCEFKPYKERCNQ